MVIITLGQDAQMKPFHLLLTHTQGIEFSDLVNKIKQAGKGKDFDWAMTQLNNSGMREMLDTLALDRVGSVEQYIQHGKSSLIADVGDVEKLAHYVNHLIDQPDESLIMGRSARVIATKELGVQLASEKHNGIYRAVIKNTNIS